MEKNKECKILFNTLIQRMWKNNRLDKQIDKPLYQIQEIIAYILKQSRINKFYDLKGNKFCFLESANVVSNSGDVTISGFFKSARNEFRPDLINRRTGSERRNPKELTEGDIEKTHFVIKIDKSSDEVYLFLEYNFHGVTMNNIIGYLTVFNNKLLKKKSEKQKYSIKFLMIARDNFIAELKSVSRTKLVEVYFNKSLLGTEALNFSNRHISLKKELKLTASASPRESITEVAVDCFNKFNGKKSEITKVRVYGNDNNDNEIVLDTSFMSKVEFVSADINQETGEVNSTQLLTGMKKVAKSF